MRLHAGVRSVMGHGHSKASHAPDCVGRWLPQRLGGESPTRRSSCHAHGLRLLASRMCRAHGSNRAAPRPPKCAPCGLPSRSLGCLARPVREEAEPPSRSARPQTSMPDLDGTVWKERVPAAVERHSSTPSDFAPSVVGAGRCAVRRPARVTPSVLAGAAGRFAAPVPHRSLPRLTR